MNSLNRNSPIIGPPLAGWLARLFLASDIPAILMALALILVLVALTGCAPLPPQAASPTQEQSTPSPQPAGQAAHIPTKSAPQPANPGSELNGLVLVLQAAGAQVELGETVYEPFFSLPGRDLTVNGLSVTVFEYARPILRQAESDRISQDGFSVGSTQVDWVGQPNFWAKGRLIVLYVGQDPALMALLSQNLGAPINLPAPAGDVVTLGSAPFALAARKALSQKLGLPEDQITFVSAEEVQWSNGCLGLAGRGEFCTEMIVPGYRVIFSAGGRTVEAHTDKSGKSVRIK